MNFLMLQSIMGHLWRIRLTVKQKILQTIFTFINTILVGFLINSVTEGLAGGSGALNASGGGGILNPSSLNMPGAGGGAGDLKGSEAPLFDGMSASGAIVEPSDK